MKWDLYLDTKYGNKYRISGIFSEFSINIGIIIYIYIYLVKANFREFIIPEKVTILPPI